MGKILQYIAQETQGECFTSFKYCYDNMATPHIEYEAGESSYKNLKDYADGIWSYVSNFMTPWSLTSVLKKHEIKYKILKYRFIKKAERLRLLKEEIL